MGSVKCSQSGGPRRLGDHHAPTAAAGLGCICPSHFSRAYGSVRKQVSKVGLPVARGHRESVPMIAGPSGARISTRWLMMPFQYPLLALIRMRAQSGVLARPASMVL